MLLSVSSTMGIVLDVLIVALLAIFGLIGFRKGFFKSILALFSTLAVIAISIFFAGYLANLVNKLYDFTGLISSKMSDGIASMGAFYSEIIPAGVSGKDIINSIPSGTNGFLKKLMSYVFEPLSASDIEGLTVAEIVSGSFASIIMLIICAIVLFILIKIIIAIVSRLFDNITRNRVFGAVNKLGGLAFGAAKGLLIVVVFSFVLTLLTVVPPINNKMTPIIQDHTNIARPIYNYTDEFVEKHVVNGKIVQKWIDNLWENKYKDRGDDAPVVDTTPDGSVEKPYVISFTENEGQFISSVDITFDESNTSKYYTFNADSVGSETFTLEITINNVTYTLYSGEVNGENLISTYTQLAKTDAQGMVKYILKFERNSTEITSENAIIVITAE